MHMSVRLMAVVLCAVLLGGCAKTVTKQDRFPGMYEEEPTSILLLPPMNQSTAADAKQYYSTTIQEPLSQSGYYTFPMPITDEILKQEGVYDTEMLYNLPVNKFKEYFGADAVLFTTIRKWDLVYMVIAGNLTVSFDSEIRSTTTNRVLWKYNGTVVVDLSGGGGADPISLVFKAVVTAVNCAAADYVPYAKLANYRAYSALPVGKYHARHMKDQSDKIIDQGAVQQPKAAE
ncbi:GNA1162 family protein [Desulfobaculum sp. SPO524]|uniref:GNA1162 family protein n=1 Tax=Desulfobaculum sp. SPO524 TaxID=3378071 RepID=UPI0038531F80